jgi:hypothetical protein
MSRDENIAAAALATASPQSGTLRSAWKRR